MTIMFIQLTYAIHALLSRDTTSFVKIVNSRRTIVEIKLIIVIDMVARRRTGGDCDKGDYS